MMRSGCDRCVTEAKPPTTASTNAAMPAGNAAAFARPRNSSAATHTNVQPAMPVSAVNSTSDHWIEIVSMDLRLLREPSRVNGVGCGRDLVDVVPCRYLSDRMYFVSGLLPTSLRVCSELASAAATALDASEFGSSKSP